MKQMWALILACALCMSLAACNSEPNAGTADGIVTDAAQSGKFAIRELLYGSWQDINDGTVYQFESDGFVSRKLYKIVENEAYMDTETGSFTFSGDTLNVTIKDSEFTLVPETKENVVHLIDTENRIDCVPRSEFGQFVEKVRIDTENLEEYFELRTSQSVVRDSEGKVCGGVTCDGYFLKDEYYARLMPVSMDNESRVEVSAKEQAENEWIKENEQTGEIEFSPGYSYGDSEPTVYALQADQLMAATIPKKEGIEFLMNDPNQAFAAISPVAYGTFYSGADWVGPDGALSVHTTITELLSASGTIYLKIK